MRLCISALTFAFVISWCAVLAAEPTHGSHDNSSDRRSSSTHFTVTPDYRKCASPMCGGWFVTAVNRKSMKCPDRTTQKQCYVGTNQINIPGLTDDQVNLLRQAMYDSRVLIQGELSSAVAYGLFIIDDAWISATTQAPEGKFLSVSDNGIRCITFPCLSYDAEVLNKKLMKTLAVYDLSNVNATKEQLELAQKAVSSSEGLPLAGRFFEVTGPAGNAQGVAATQFYLKLVGEKPRICMPTGCSGQLCSDTNVATTCEWKPEYDCYRSAMCTTQNNGDCGWVMDDTLTRCLANASINKLLR